jgi:hypothetical protein
MLLNIAQRQQKNRGNSLKDKEQVKGIDKQKLRDQNTFIIDTQKKLNIMISPNNQSSKN